MADAALPLSQKTLAVGELTRYLKYIVEHDELLTQLSVRGEVSDLSRSPSGHYYFSLKDAQSQISCVLFRREAAQQTALQDLRPGMAVVVHGFLTVYEPRGSCQIYVERVIPQGRGEASRRFEELRARLEREGLFADERKRPLPTFPRTLALITSPGSQAYHDVMHRLRVQYPFARVIEVGVSVQGDGAAEEMSMAIDIVNRLTDSDLILLVRGGGAPEELACFNDERLVRAVFASRVPIVTGVGHETDITLVDYVADRRAATPSLAVAVGVPDIGGVIERMRQLHSQLRQATGQRLRLERSRWISANQALLRANPNRRVAVQKHRSGALSGGLQRAMDQQMRQRKDRVRGLRAQLEALDPLAILARGYAVLTDAETGSVVAATRDAVPGRVLRAQVSDGQFSVRVDPA